MGDAVFSEFGHSHVLPNKKSVCNTVLQGRFARQLNKIVPTHGMEGRRDRYRIKYMLTERIWLIILNSSSMYFIN